MSPMRPASPREREKAIELAKEYLRRRKAARWDETSDTWLKAARYAADVPDQLVPYFLKLGLVQLDNQRRRKQEIPILPLPMVPQSGSDALSSVASTEDLAASLLTLLNKYGPLSCRQICTKLRLSESQVRHLLERQLNGDMVSKEGGGYGGVYYRATATAIDAEEGEV